MDENIKQSYFAVLGQRIYDEVRKVFHSTDARHEMNSLQCIPALQLQLRYVAYLPLCSGMLLGDLERHENGSEVTPSSMHATKTVAEIWMKIVKQNILVGRKRLRPAEFIISRNKNRKGRLREFNMAKKTVPSGLKAKKTRKKKN